MIALLDFVKNSYFPRNKFVFLINALNITYTQIRIYLLITVFCEPPIYTPRSYLEFSDIPDQKDYNKLIVQFDEIDCRSIAIVGGKGASLGLLQTSTNSEV